MATQYEGYYFYGTQDPRGRLLTSLGFTVPATLDSYIGADGFGGNVPGGQVSLLDLDTVVWLADDATAATLEADPVYSTLGVARENRDVLVTEGEPLNDAVSFVTPLSIPFLLDELAPRLGAAVDGDPATVPTP